MFREALAAVAVARAAATVSLHIDWPGSTEEERAAWEAEYMRDRAARYAEVLGQARESLARASAWDPTLTPYYLNEATRVVDDADQVVAILRRHI